jgi:hypothetical protein
MQLISTRLAAQSRSTAPVQTAVLRRLIASERVGQVLQALP